MRSAFRKGYVDGLKAARKVVAESLLRESAKPAQKVTVLLKDDTFFTVAVPAGDGVDAQQYVAYRDEEELALDLADAFKVNESIIDDETPYGEVKALGTALKATLGEETAYGTVVMKDGKWLDRAKMKHGALLLWLYAHGVDDLESMEQLEVYGREVLRDGSRKDECDALAAKAMELYGKLTKENVADFCTDLSYALERRGASVWSIPSNEDGDCDIKDADELSVECEGFKDGSKLLHSIMGEIFPKKEARYERDGSVEWVSVEL